MALCEAVFLLSPHQARQPYRPQSLHMPGNTGTAAVLKTAIKETHCFIPACVWRVWEKPRRTTVRTADVQADVQTGHFPQELGFEFRPGKRCIYSPKRLNRPWGPPRLLING